MTDYDRFIDYTTYDIDLIRHERSVKGVISNGTCYIAPLIWLISHVFKSPCLNKLLAIHEQVTLKPMHKV